MLPIRVDLLAIGCSGHSGLWRGLRGPTADKVGEDAPCSALVAP
jgi:nucleotide-binding universal stress UspA family protein